MDFALRAGKEKWEREQKQAKDQARARLERERKAKEEALRQREALEAEQRQRRVKEAEAAAAARQQEESDLFAGDGVRFNVVLQAILVPGDGDKIRLPTSAFEHLSSQGALEKGPMFFEIALINGTSAPGNGVYLPDALLSKTTHAGVLQFTAIDGFAELPVHVWRNLGLSETQELSGGSHFVRVRYVRLPKCTYAKLQSEASDFADVPNHKAVLETKLRQHATLSQDDFLTVQYGVTSYNLRVLELRPAANVSVLETDMEVDVLEAPSTSTQSRLVPLELDKPQEGVVKEGCYNYYKLIFEQKILDKIFKGDRAFNICLEIKGDESSGDADLYVAAHPILFPTQHQYQWSSHDLGTKVVTLTGGEKALVSSSYSVGVFGFRGITPYRIWVEALPTQQHAAGQKVGSVVRQQTTGTIEEGFELCGNCRQAIPGKTIALHEAYCRRHNAACSFPGCSVVLRKEDFTKHVHCLKCGQSLQPEELEKHLKVFHEPQICKCGAVLAREAMVTHQANCPLRMITCKFCGDMVQAGTEAENIKDKLHGLTQHESICGARTAPCDSCGRAVMLKEMDLHRDAAHTAVPPTSMSPTRLAPFTVPNGGTHPEVMAEQDEPINLVHCPVCSVKFEGLAAEGQLNAHLDSEHFLTNVDSRMQMDATTASVPPLSDSSYRSSLSVSCPICGLAVHSERDLSSHMDMVH